jgi:glucokinase
MFLSFISMTQLLAGDIGGTKTILRLIQALPSQAPQTHPDLLIHYEAQYPSQDYEDLVPMVNRFLDQATQVMGTPSQPLQACFGIAGPVVNNTCQLTNLSWHLTGDRLAQALSLKTVNLINDFAAVGYGVLGLQNPDLCSLQEVHPDSQAPIGVIGAGTGLGQGFLAPQGQGYQVYATEGGHSNFAPRSQVEFELLQYLQEQLGITRVSVERVVSGQGIVGMYQFLRDRQQRSESPEIAALIRTWEQDMEAARPSAIDPAGTIAQAAPQDPLCRSTMEWFVELYGVETGNFALKLLPYGGLYIAGGIAAKNLDLMRSGRFMQAFRDKGRVSGVLDRIPVSIVLNPQVGLIGAGLYAARGLNHGNGQTEST